MVNMTLAEAVALPPGRQKDAIVAEVVMGWTYRRDCLVFDDVTYSWLSSSGKPMNPGGLTTTGDGMMLVIERMRELGYRIRFHESQSGLATATFLNYPTTNVYCSHSESIPDAVANAALKATWKGER